MKKFYDAKFTDIRDGSKKSGADLSCGRTNRSEPRQSEQSQRVFRGRKLSKGRRSIRKNHYPLQPGDTVIVGTSRYKVKGTHCRGTRVMLDSGKSVAVKKISRAVHLEEGTFDVVQEKWHVFSKRKSNTSMKVSLKSVTFEGQLELTAPTGKPVGF